MCLTLWDPMDCSLPGSSVHGVLQERILDRVAMPSSRGSLTECSNLCLLQLLHCRWILYQWSTTREVQRIVYLDYIGCIFLLEKIPLKWFFKTFLYRFQVFWLVYESNWHETGWQEKITFNLICNRIPHTWEIQGQKGKWSLHAIQS